MASDGVLMAASFPASTIKPQPNAVPGRLFAICFVLMCINVSFFPAAFLSGGWIWEENGLGIPTDFVNVWAAGKLALQGQPALAWDWDIQRQIEFDALRREFSGYFAWHYPPPFLFVAAFLAQFPYTVAFVGWVCASFVPYVIVMRAIVGQAFGVMLAVGFPIVLTNALVGQNGFLTAALIGGTLLLLPIRPVLAGICLGFLTYKPQYGVLFPIVLIATQRWTTFVSAGVTAITLAVVAWLAFGIESWQAFFHWMPTFSQRFLLSEKTAIWWSKLQSVFSLVRYFGGGEKLAWSFQWVLTAAVVVTLITLWRSRVRYSLKAAALAVGTLLTTPYLFMYDMMVLAIPVAFLVRMGLKDGFLRYELPALYCVTAFLVVFTLFGIQVGLAANLIVMSLILRRAGTWWRHEPAQSEAVVAGA